MGSDHWKTQPRRPAGTPIGGEWDTTAGGGAATSLGAFADDDGGRAGGLPPGGLEPAEQVRARVARIVEDDIGPGGVPAMMKQFDTLMAECDELGVPRDYAAAVYAAEHVGEFDELRRVTPYGSLWGNSQALTLKSAFDSGMPADWPVQMRRRGPGWDEFAVIRWNGGLTADEIARLDTIRDDADLVWRADWCASLVGADLGVITSWSTGALDLAAPENAGFREWLAGTKRPGDYASYGNARRMALRCAASGITVDQMRFAKDHGVDASTAFDIYSGSPEKDALGTHLSPEGKIMEVGRYVGAAGQQPDRCLAAIKAGVDAGTLKEYGSKVDVFLIMPLRDAGVPGNVARSLCGVSRNVVEFTGPGAAKAMAALYDAGITTKADLEGFAESVAPKTRLARGTTTWTQKFIDDGVPPEPWKPLLKAARAGLSGRDFQALGGKDIGPEAALALRRGGIASMADWNAAAISPSEYPLGYRAVVSDPSIPRAAHPMAFARALVAFHQAGGTPLQMRRAMRAGIPLDRAAAHATDTPEQLWKAGKSNRERVLREARDLDDQDAAAAWPVSGPGEL